jgi:phosphoglycolate phosphatase
MRYRLVVFDFDGTLADSLGPAVELFNKLAPDLRLRPIVDIEAARSTPTRKFLRQHGIRFWRLPRVIRAFQAAAAVHADQIRLHDGVATVLEGLRSQGHRLGVLSSNREETIRACLRAAGVEHHFDFVVGYPKLFGKAKALRRIMKRERIDRAEMLFVGDELRDVEAGRKARVQTVAVTWGFHAEGLLTGGRPTFVVRHPDELLGVTTAA